MLHTVSGLEIDVNAFKQGDVRAYDIAWALSNLHLFTGHSAPAWDALSHTGLMYMLYIQDVHGKTEVSVALAVLLNIANMSYTGDRGYSDLGMMRSIYSRFNVPSDMCVERYDKQATAIEYHVLFPNVKNGPQLEYPLAKYPLLVKAKVDDYVTMLKHLSINNNVDDIDTLFAVPESLKPYLTSSESTTDNVKIDVKSVDTSSVENLRT